MDLVTEQVSDPDFQQLNPLLYSKVVSERHMALKSTSLRFVPESNPNFYDLEKPRRRCFCIKIQRRNDLNFGKPFSQMDPEERQERLSYLRFRMRCIVHATLFINYLNKHLHDSDYRRITKYHNKLITESEQEAKEQKAFQPSLNMTDVGRTTFLIIMSVSLWFNLVSSPLIILWPEITDQEKEGKTFYYLLWLNELLFLLDIIRKFFDAPKRGRALDVYENAINYAKSTLILDVMSTLPQVASGLNNSFVWFKIIRLYQYDLLHYPLEALVNIFYSQKEKRKVFVIVYACQTLCQIAMLLHYLAVVWLWVGSDYFLDFEEDYQPWQFSIDDFRGQPKYRLYVFSVYWVCTVVTTVGYGDYAGTTSLERVYTFLLEFFGLIVFSVLQVAVQQVVNHDASFDNFIIQMDQRITLWLMNLEKSNQKNAIPKELYKEIEHSLWLSFRRDPSLIVKEFDFY